jgi:hypothetical protein
LWLPWNMSMMILKYTHNWSSFLCIRNHWKLLQKSTVFYVWTASTMLGWVHKIREYMSLKSCFLFAICYISNRFWRILWLDTHLITCGCSCLCHTFGDCICLFSGCSLQFLAQREYLLQHLAAMKGKSGCSCISYSLPLYCNCH